MKIAIAQIKPSKGDISNNILHHLDMIRLAVSCGAAYVFFPELSITAYEPSLAKALSTTANDKTFDVFQNISDQSHITIGIGMPLTSENSRQIAMVVFQAQRPRISYAKQLLHPDERPFFVAGQQQIILTNGKQRIAPAICFESLQVQHAKQAVEQGANLYLASVAKSQKGINRANEYFPWLAKQYAIPILMANCVGFCDNFESVGQSAAWNKKGERIAKLNKDKEGVLVYDSITQTASVEYLVRDKPSI